MTFDSSLKTQLSSSSSTAWHLFVSYHWNSESIVNNLITYLRKLFKIDIWFDKEQLKLNKFDNNKNEIENAIENSELFLCFINRIYCKTQSIIDQIQYAKQLKKRIIVVMLESANNEELGDVGIIINGRLRINAYKEISLFKESNGDEFKRLIKSLSNTLDLAPQPIKVQNSLGETTKSGKKINPKQPKQQQSEVYELPPLLKGKIL